MCQVNLLVVAGLICGPGICGSGICGSGFQPVNGSLTCGTAVLPVIRAFSAQVQPTTPARESARDSAEGELQDIVVLKPGDVAPDFEVPGLDGKFIRLSDYRGRYVLLDFWATWCGPCRAEMPGLKKLQEIYGNDKRFALIGLSLDDTMKAMGDFVKEQGLTWTHGHVGPSKKSPVPGRYGVRGIPRIVLIGPDGKIIKPNLTYEGARDALRDLLPLNEEALALHADEVKGTVLFPDGRPAATAKVFLCVGTAQLHFKGDVPAVDESRSHRTVFENTANEDGAFSFEPLSDTYSIVAMHEQGYAQVKDEHFRRNTVIRLQEWARIEGLVTIDDPPMSVFLASYALKGDRLAHFGEVTPDAAGRFVFERVPPGNLAWIQLRHGLQNTSYNIWKHDIPPAEVIACNFGSHGHTISGSVKWPDSISEPRSPSYRARVELKRALGMPPEIMAAGREAMGKWQKAWRDSPEGREANRRPSGHATELTKENSFRFLDVPPGIYRLHYEHRSLPPRYFRSSVFEVSMERDDTLELGILELEEYDPATTPP